VRRCATVTISTVAAEAAAVVFGLGTPALIVVAAGWLGWVGAAAAASLRAPRTPPVAAAPTRSPEPVARRVSQIEALISEASREAAAYHVKLRPILRSVSAARLGRRGITLDGDGVDVVALLGEESYALVAPDRGAPSDRFASGPPIESLENLLERLERL
jgi:hypothetical protein